MKKTEQTENKIYEKNTYKASTQGAVSRHYIETRDCRSKLGVAGRNCRHQRTD